MSTKATKKQHTKPAIPAGQVSVKLETPGGEVKAFNVKVRGGHPRVRILGIQESASTAVIMKIASGEKLNEAEIADNPAVAMWEKPKALAWITELVAKGSHLIEVLPTK